MSYSLNALRAFEAAARHLSFKLAAEELHLSPTAVSHQIRGLEASLGIKLFDRQVRRVTLTPDGEEFARDLGPAFSDIDKAVARLATRPRRPIVTLGAGPIIASRWLAPRLGQFWAMHPDIDLRIHHSSLPYHQQLTRFDLAIAWGDGSWMAGDARPLLSIQLTPVHAPEVSFRAGLDDDPACLLDLPLLHHRDFDQWRTWLTQAGVKTPDHLPGAVFDDANVLLQAAIESQGVALGILPLIADEIALGRLVCPWPKRLAGLSAYYLVEPKGGQSDRPVMAVRDWLLSINDR